jgi:nucleoid DNA-binding protein
MNKSELVKKVSDELLVDSLEVREVIDIIFDMISDSLGDGDNVTITGFGSFNLVRRAARTARNPKTGEELNVPEKTVVSFISSGKLKGRVNNG